MGAAIVLALTLGFALRDRIGRAPPAAGAAALAVQPQKSVAVLPFLDLTSEAMSEEYVADGVTEELFDRLSKIPGLRVAAPTSSFHFKGKKATIADIAKALHVAYVLDGSIRRAGPRLRVAMRLIRTDNGFVIWTETYDRQSGDILKVQVEIASDVAKALRARI
jgi:transcriptional activator of cad operon